MKLIIASALLLSSSFAHADIIVGGNSAFLQAEGKKARIHVTGGAAVQLMKAMSDDLLQTSDASESPTGERIYWKDGRDISCQSSANETLCIIAIDDVKGGKIVK